MDNKINLTPFIIAVSIDFLFFTIVSLFFCWASVYPFEAPDFDRQANLPELCFTTAFQLEGWWECLFGTVGTGALWWRFKVILSDWLENLSYSPIPALVAGGNNLKIKYPA